MCKFCDLKNSTKYSELLRKSFNEDELRLEFTKELAKDSSFITCYSSLEKNLIFPMFEARTAYAVPQNYFQPLVINGEKTGNTFAHGSTRSLFFANNRLYLLSKNVNYKDGKEFFTSYLLVGFAFSELNYKWNRNNLTINADCKKKLKNLISGGDEDVAISFNFTSTDLTNMIVSREQILASSHVQSVYSKYGSVDGKMASVDIHGYGVTVAHFSPHPYLFLVKEELGFKNNREMQEKVVDYFKAHLP